MPVELLIVPLSLLAFIVKGVAGFGPGIVLVPAGALLFGVAETVVVIGALDLLSNAVLFRVQRDWQRWRNWLPLAGAVVLGSLPGAWLLATLPAATLELLLGALLLPFAIWFTLGARRSAAAASASFPARPAPRDLAAAAVSGVAGGLVGITGPALAATLGQRYVKTVFRAIVVPVFLFSALARVAVYGSAGLFDQRVALLLVLALPGLALGIAIGNRLFRKISELWFRRVLGALVALAGVRLLS